MPDHRPVLLLTRTQAQSERFAGRFRARFGRDWPVVISPLIAIRDLPAALPQQMPPHIVFTSENAVAAWCRRSGDRSALAWCVGARTAEAAAAAGFRTRVGPGDAAGLARLVAETVAGEAVLYPHGAETAFDMAAALAERGLRPQAVALYAQEPVPPAAAAVAVLRSGGDVLLPLFSRNAARRAAAEFGRPSARLLIACIAPAVAEAAAPLGAARLRIAARPDAGALLDALADLVAEANSA
ncbi:uroporphyrinogen-III synthase [Albidovulum sp.]